METDPFLVVLSDIKYSVITSDVIKSFDCYLVMCSMFLPQAATVLYFGLISNCVIPWPYLFNKTRDSLKCSLHL